MTIVGVAASVYLGNFLLALILLIGVTCIVALAIRGPREHNVKVTHRGVVLDGTLHPWRGIESFWVDDDRDDPRLFLTTHSLLHPHLTIPLDDASHADRVRQHIRRYCEELEQGPRFGEELAEILGL